MSSKRKLNHCDDENRIYAQDRVESGFASINNIARSTLFIEGLPVIRFYSVNVSNLLSVI